jgi:hypothetical protein
MAAFGGCGPDLPPVDSCSQPASAGVSTVDFVSISGMSSIAVDLQPQAVIIGPQGGSMVELRFNLEGDAIPECVNVKLTAEKCLDLECTALEEAEVFPVERALRTYENDGGRNTKNYLMEIPFRFNAGTLIRISVEVGTATGALRMWIEQEGVLLDAGLSDADPLRDAGPSDAIGG